MTRRIPGSCRAARSPADNDIPINCYYLVGGETRLRSPNFKFVQAQTQVELNLATIHPRKSQFVQPIIIQTLLLINFKH